MLRKFAIILWLLTCGTFGLGASGNAASLSGHFGFSFSGTVINSAGFSGPIAGVGDFDLNGSGSITGSETFNVNGTSCFGHFAGTYNTTASGEGTVSAPFTPVTSGCPSGTISLTYTAVDSGKKLYFLQNATDKVVSGVAEKK